MHGASLQRGSKAPFVAPSDGSEPVQLGDAMFGRSLVVRFVLSISIEEANGELAPESGDVDAAHVLRLNILHKCADLKESCMVFAPNQEHSVVVVLGNSERLSFAV